VQNDPDQATEPMGVTARYHPEFGTGNEPLKWLSTVLQEIWELP
jgi:hypothetical protein